VSREGGEVVGSGPSASARTGAPRLLRIAPRRLLVWGVAVAVVGLLPALTAPAALYHDFSAFWSAGATVGTPDLVDATRHAEWQLARGLPAAFWSYPPATAWLYWPLARLDLAAGYAVNALAMLALVGVAGALAARIYGLPPAVAVLAALAWAPSTASIVLGQNAVLGLVLALIAIAALQNDRPALAGLATGLLLYKPTLALGLLAFLAFRGQWRALLVAAAVGGALFLASIPAAGGEPGWLGAWLAGATSWLPADAAGNADKHVSLPGLLSRVTPSWVGLLAGGAVALLAVPGLRRAPLVEAASAACLLGIALGPRSWGYDAALAFPFVAWLLAGGIGEPWRTRAIVAAYLLALTWPLSWATTISGVAIVVLVASGWWIWRWRPDRLLVAPRRD
jgi:hypothetical protein